MLFPRSKLLTLFNTVLHQNWSYQRNNQCTQSKLSRSIKKMKCLNPILCQALGYAEYIRGEPIYPRTLAVNTACILQGIQFFCPLNKYFILSSYVESIIFDITCFTSKQQMLKVFAHGSPFFLLSAIVVFALFSQLAGEMSGKFKNSLSDLQTMIYILVDIQFKDLKFDTHERHICLGCQKI